MPPTINGKFHLVLVVREAQRSSDWYSRVFGFVMVRKSPAESVVPDPMGGTTAFDFTTLFHVPTRMFLGLAEPRDRPADPFDWRRAGLQHFAFHVEERAELDEWSRHLKSLGIAHSPVLAEGPGLVVRFHDPDQIPVEVCWPDLARCEQLFTIVARTRAQAARERRKARRGT